MVLRVRRGGHNERTGVFLDRAFSRQIAPARPSRPVKSSFCCEIEVANRAQPGEPLTKINIIAAITDPTATPGRGRAYSPKKG